jgi:hypothetical protein
MASYSLEKALERQERSLEAQYENGELTQVEYRQQLRELYRDARAYEREAQQRDWDL